MSQFKSMYTELLSAAIEAADVVEVNNLSLFDKQEWRDARKAWRKELYRGRDKISPLSKIKLDKVST